MDRGNEAWFAGKILECLAGMKKEARHNFFYPQGGHITRWLGREPSETELAAAQYVFDELLRQRLIYQASEIGWFSITDAGKEVLKTGAFKEMFPPTEDGSTYVFLSHATLDKEIALFLKSELERRVPNLKVFLSCDPEDLPPGRTWSTEIRKALRRSKALLLLATKRSLSRPWVWLEAGAMWIKDQEIICICLEGIQKGGLPAPLSDYQALDAYDSRELSALLEALARMAGGSVADTDVGPLLERIAALEKDVLAANWRGAEWTGRFLAYDGPTTEFRQLEPWPFQGSMVAALEANGFDVRLGRSDRLSSHLDKGYSKVCLTDRRTWYREIKRNQDTLLARPKEASRPLLLSELAMMDDDENEEHN